MTDPYALALKTAAADLSALVSETRMRLDAIMAELNEIDCPGLSITARDVLSAVSKASGIAEKSLVSDSRDGTFRNPRFAIYYLCRTKACLSFPMIGRHLGDRDPSTIQHGTKRAAQLLETDRDFCALVKRASAALEKSA